MGIRAEITYIAPLQLHVFTIGIHLICTVGDFDISLEMKISKILNYGQVWKPCAE